jgi:hypothetical protein
MINYILYLNEVEMTSIEIWNLAKSIRGEAKVYEAPEAPVAGDRICFYLPALDGSLNDKSVSLVVCNREWTTKREQWHLSLQVNCVDPDEVKTVREWIQAARENKLLNN